MNASDLAKLSDERAMILQQEAEAQRAREEVRKEEHHVRRIAQIRKEMTDAAMEGKKSIETNVAYSDQSERILAELQAEGFKASVESRSISDGGCRGNPFSVFRITWYHE